MKYNRLFIVFILSVALNSCIGLKSLKYVQPSENTKLNEFGLISVEYETYRVKKDDMLAMTLITADKDAAIFLGAENTDAFKGGGGGGKGTNDASFKVGGLNVDANGNIQIYGLGVFYVEGLTLKEISDNVQKRLNDTLYKEGRAEVRINLAGINYILMGEINSPGEKIEHRNRVSLLEAIAKAGDLTQVADRKNVKLIREYPEGKKFIILDVTDESVMNSPYFYLQSGDLVIIDPRKEKVTGLGGSTFVGDITQGLNLAIMGMGMYMFFKNYNK